MAEERLSERGYELSNKELRKLIIPLLGEQIFAICVGLADSLMVAGVSNAAVSAVSLVDSVSNLIIYICGIENTNHIALRNNITFRYKDFTYGHTIGSTCYFLIISGFDNTIATNAICNRSLCYLLNGSP